MSSAMFGTLESSSESRRRRSVALISALLIHMVVIGTAIFLGILFPEKLPASARRYVIVWLPSVLPPPAPVVNSPRQVAQVATPKLELPVKPDPPVVAATDLELPKIRPVAPPLVASLPQPPLPAPSFAQPNAPPKVQIIEVHTGTFGGASEPVATQRPADQVQTGGFGSLQGFRGEAQGESVGNVTRVGSAGFPGGPGVGNGTGGAHGVRAQSAGAANPPKLGSFGLPAGPGAGNGAGGTQGIPGVVASAGFGGGVAATGYAQGGGGTGVAVSGFEKVGQVAQFPLKSLPAPQPTEFQPVELLSKPSPVYTEEARRLGIQGEVTLSVVFQAGGAIRILEVVNSLGHGLDQAAQQAASQIRFKPARRNGKPVDFPATLRIEFRLADQTI
jgi:TonB family protein